VADANQADGWEEVRNIYPPQPGTRLPVQVAMLRGFLPFLTWAGATSRYVRGQPEPFGLLPPSCVWWQEATMTPTTHTGWC